MTTTRARYIVVVLHGPGRPSHLTGRMFKSAAEERAAELVRSGTPAKAVFVPRRYYRCQVCTKVLESGTGAPRHCRKKTRRVWT